MEKILDVLTHSSSLLNLPDSTRWPRLPPWGGPHCVPTFPGPQDYPAATVERGPTGPCTGDDGGGGGGGCDDRGGVYDGGDVSHLCHDHKT